MTNTLAICLAVIICGVLALDIFVYEWGLVQIGLIFLVDLIAKMAFWR